MTERRIFKAQLGGQIVATTLFSYGILAVVAAAMCWEACLIDERMVIAAVILTGSAIGSLLFRIRYYEVTPDQVVIYGTGWKRSLARRDIIRAERLKNAFQGAWRIFGNGGIWCVSGRFKSRDLGKFRAYVSDPKRVVLIVLRDDVILISPSDPNRFLKTIGAGSK